MSTIVNDKIGEKTIKLLRYLELVVTGDIEGLVKANLCEVIKLVKIRVEKSFVGMMSSYQSNTTSRIALTSSYSIMTISQSLYTGDIISYIIHRHNKT